VLRADDPKVVQNGLGVTLNIVKAQVRPVEDLKMAKARPVQGNQKKRAKKSKKEQNKSHTVSNEGEAHKGVHNKILMSESTYLA